MKNPTKLSDSKIKTLFASRPLLNTDEIRQWANEQGFSSTLADGDMHVTIAFSKEPFNWSNLKPKEKKLIVRGGRRTIEQLGDEGAITLCFESTSLKARWEEFIEAGASWDFPTYKSHVTISYEDKDLNLKSIKPYEGELVFGFEEFKEINDDWVDDMEEDDL